MNQLDWLIGHRFDVVVRREFSWGFIFDDDIAIESQSTWRLLEQGRIVVASEDEGQRFGRPAPMDLVVEVGLRISGSIVTGICLQAGTLDLRLQFDSGDALELISNSSGYESWAVSAPGRSFIAAGGGELAIFNDAGERFER